MFRVFRYETKRERLDRAADRFDTIGTAVSEQRFRDLAGKEAAPSRFRDLARSREEQRSFQVEQRQRAVAKRPKPPPKPVSTEIPSPIEPHTFFEPGETLPPMTLAESAAFGVAAPPAPGQLEKSTALQKKLVEDVGKAVQAGMDPQAAFRGIFERNKVAAQEALMEEADKQFAEILKENRRDWENENEVRAAMHVVKNDWLPYWGETEFTRWLKETDNTGERNAVIRTLGQMDASQIPEEERGEVAKSLTKAVKAETGLKLLGISIDQNILLWMGTPQLAAFTLAMLPGEAAGKALGGAVAGPWGEMGGALAGGMATGVGGAMAAGRVGAALKGPSQMQIQANAIRGELAEAERLLAIAEAQGSILLPGLTTTRNALIQKLALAEGRMMVAPTGAQMGAGAPSVTPATLGGARAALPAVDEITGRAGLVGPSEAEIAAARTAARPGPVAAEIPAEGGMIPSTVKAPRPQTPPAILSTRFPRAGEVARRLTGVEEARALGPEPRMVLTNNIPIRPDIEARLAEVNAQLAKGRVKGGKLAKLNEKARLEAQQEIRKILDGDLPPDLQLSAVEAELESMRVELQLRALPFRGKWRVGKKFIPDEKETRMGAETAADRAGRPGRAQREAAEEAARSERYPGVTTNELNAKERVYKEFVENPKFVPEDELAAVERGVAEIGPPATKPERTFYDYELALEQGKRPSEAAMDRADVARINIRSEARAEELRTLAKQEAAKSQEPLVERSRMTPEGEVVKEPTFATEGEVGGVRPEQAELGIGAGERPIETAGPLFEQRAAAPTRAELYKQARDLEIRAQNLTQERFGSKADLNVAAEADAEIKGLVDQATALREQMAGARVFEERIPIRAEGVPPPRQGGPPERPTKVGTDVPDEAGVISPEPRPGAPPPPEGPPPGILDGIAMEPPKTPTGLLARFMDRLPGRAMEQSDWAKYVGGLAAEGQEIRLARFDLIDTAKKVPKIGKRLTSNHRNPDNEAMLLALHGEGEIPKGAEAFHQQLQDFLRLHEGRTMADVPSFERRLLPQYFPRAWKNGAAKVNEYKLGLALERGELDPVAFMREHTKMVKSGKLGPGAKPGTLKHRTLPMTFREAIEKGWEPISWNPADTVSLHAAQLADYRYSYVLGELWKAQKRAIPKSAAPESWVAPRYPAFESQPYVTKTGEVGWSEPLRVAPEDMQMLDAMLGTRPTDITDVMAYTTSVFKRSKVLASYFQHLDFTIRTVNRALTRGDVHMLAAAPKAMAANFFPPLRRKLWNSLMKDPEIVQGMEEGLQLAAGLDVFKRQVGFALEKDLVVRAPFLGDIPTGRLPAGTQRTLKGVQDKLNGIYSYFSEGLFDGAAPQYMAAFYKSLRKELKRAHPELSERQTSALAAHHSNIMMSNIPDWQSVLKRWRQLGRGVAFSINEAEGWTLQGVNTVFKGSLPGARGLYMRQWAGYIFGTLAIAELFNYAITGEWLAEEQLLPITFENGRPEYNTKFARPRLDGEGPLGSLLGIKGAPILDDEGNPTGDHRHIFLDLLGQADTAFRMFSPYFFVMTRLSPQLSVALQQWKGEEYFGEKPLGDTWSRLGFAAEQLLEPISITASGFPGPLTKAGLPEIIPPGEEQKRIGEIGAAVQTVGVNVSAERLGELRDRAFREETAKIDAERDYNKDSPADRRIMKENDRLRAIRDEGRRIGIELGSPTALAAEATRELIAAEEENRGLVRLAQSVMAGDTEAMGRWGDERANWLAARSGIFIRAQADQEYPEPETEIGILAQGYHSLNPKDPRFTDIHGQTDWDAYEAAQEKVKARIRALPNGAAEVAAMEEGDKFQNETAETVDREWRGARELKDAYYEIPKYLGLDKDEGDQIDDYKDQVNVQALRTAELTGDADVDTTPIWRSLLPGMTPKIKAWVQKYVLRPRAGESYGRKVVKEMIRDSLQSGMVRDLVMERLFPDQGSPDPQNPERLLFKIQHLEDLNLWFPQDFPVSREMAASGVIPTTVIEAQEPTGVIEVAAAK
jgi:hypothetical protein